MVKNLEAAKRLVEWYDSISTYQIHKSQRGADALFADALFLGVELAQRLVGFGDKDTCILCESAGQDCKNCIHALAHSPAERKQFKANFCSMGASAPTYTAIFTAQNPTALKKAFRMRAQYIRSLIERSKK